MTRVPLVSHPLFRVNMLWSPIATGHPVPPYGYKKVKISDGPRLRPSLEPIPAAAAMVQRVFREIASGKGLKRVCMALNAEGISPPGRRPWNSTTLHCLLNNEAYLGVMVWGRTSKNGHRQNPIRAKGTWTPIIDQELFDRAQAALKSRDPSHIIPGGPPVGTC